MSKPVITIQATASLKEAMDKMNSNNIRRLVVVDSKNKMIGIITEKDIFKPEKQHHNIEQVAVCFLVEGYTKSKY